MKRRSLASGCFLSATLFAVFCQAQGNLPIALVGFGAGANAGSWTDDNMFPRRLGDVNGDGKVDIVGFGQDGVWVALSTGSGFGPPTKWLAAFSTSAGWTSNQNFPRLVADVNGDGKADIVGFAKDGVYVSLSTGTGFSAPVKWVSNFGQDSGGWSSFDTYPRVLADVNGDGKADIIGFGQSATYVSLSTGSSFSPPTPWINNFAQTAGWTSFDTYPRMVADVNGDGKADIIGFGVDGVYVSLSTGSSFSAPALWLAGLVAKAGGWTSYSQYPRLAIDLNNDKKADLVGFGDVGVYVALNTGTGFSAPVLWSWNFGVNSGWANSLQEPRLVADVEGTGWPSVVGFGSAGVQTTANVGGTKFSDFGPSPPITVSPNNSQYSFCWKYFYNRGVGIIGSGCSSGYELDGGLCYPVCPSGMKGVGPLCWQSCPAGFPDIGVSCTKPASTSSAGYGWQFGDAAFDFDTGPRARCEAVYGAGKCYKSGLIWYPLCPANFHKVGDLVCSPDCPSGMRDDGAFCAKSTSARGAGTTQACSSGMVSDTGLCYPACIPAFDGFATSCYAKCTADYPYSCGAGCSKDASSCAGAIGDMTLNTVGALLSMLGMVAGGGGVGEAARLGAQAGEKAAAATVFKVSSATFQDALRTAAKAYAKDFAKTFMKQFMTDKFVDPRTAFFTYTSLIKTAGLKGFNELSKQNAQLKDENSSVLDLSSLTALDPTGLSSMFLAFAKYSSCSVEPISTSANVVDLGATGTAQGSKTLTLYVNQPTTFTYISTPAYTNCSIQPDSDCAGKTLSAGQTCTVTVKTNTGGAALLGEIRIYTTDYDMFPYPIQVTANTGAATQCAVNAAVDEAINLTSLAGVWVWGNNSANKIIISSTGTVTPVNNWTSPGTVSLTDPVQRTFTFKFGQSGVMTLDSLGQKLIASGGLPATRRKWDSHCPPGEQLLGSLCYDVPPDYLLYYYQGQPIISQPTCPAGYMDNGPGCWPKWTGQPVWGQADQYSTSSVMQYPFQVTDCSTPTCPANWTRNACTCTPNKVTKQVFTINGDQQVN